jgi:hypothetical protein
MSELATGPCPFTIRKDLRNITALVPEHKLEKDGLGDQRSRDPLM